MAHSSDAGRQHEPEPALVRLGFGGWCICTTVDPKLWGLGLGGWCICTTVANDGRMIDAEFIGDVSRRETAAGQFRNNLAALGMLKRM